MAEQRQPPRTEEPKARPPSTLAAAGGGGRAFRETELGPLPAEWEVVRLGKVASLIMGQSPPSSTYNADGNGYPFLQGKAEFGEIHPTPIKWCSQPKKIAPRGSILIAVRAPVGDVNVAQEDYCIGRGLASISGNESLDNWFLFYVLIFAKRRLEEEGTGSIFKSINKGVLQDFLIPLPPLPEQRRIAHVLRTIRQAIEATDRVITAARELKRSLMHHLFTYGPVPVETTGRLPLRETDIGPVPAHWEVVRLGDLAQTTSGGTPSRRNLAYFSGNIPWVKSGELNDSVIQEAEEYITDEGVKNSSAKIFPQGTLLVAMYGATVGKTGILGIKAATNQAICAIFPRDDAFLSIFLMYYLIFRRRDLLKERYGGAQPNISQTLIRNFLISRPPLSEQREIARILQAVDRKIEAEERRRAALQALFKTMLHLLMTGRIRVEEGQG